MIHVPHIEIKKSRKNIVKAPDFYWENLHKIPWKLSCSRTAQDDIDSTILCRFNFCDTMEFPNSLHFLNISLSKWDFDHNAKQISNYVIIGKGAFYDLRTVLLHCVNLIFFTVVFARINLHF